jgi:ribosomal protein L16/L10AE
MLLPKKNEVPQYQRGRARLLEGSDDRAGRRLWLKALENGWVTNRQIEAAESR